MSVRLMSAIWDMQFSPVEKLVLLALADWANDDGVAWPSIAQLACKTGCGERTVQRTLRSAEDAGLLKRHENRGKGCSYTLNPRHAGTPATEAPAPEAAPTPATLAPNTPVTIKVQKASPSSQRAKGSRLPDDWKPTRFGDDTVARSIVDSRGTDWAKRVLEQFRNHWRTATGTNARKLDWQAAWANWVIEQDNRDGRRPAGISLGGNRGSGTGHGVTVDAATSWLNRRMGAALG